MQVSVHPVNHEFHRLDVWKRGISIFHLLYKRVVMLQADISKWKLKSNLVTKCISNVNRVVVNEGNLESVSLYTAVVQLLFFFPAFLFSARRLVRRVLRLVECGNRP
jgi:hypothetical protein